MTSLAQEGFTRIEVDEDDMPETKSVMAYKPGHRIFEVRGWRTVHLDVTFKMAPKPPEDPPPVPDFMPEDM